MIPFLDGVHVYSKGFGKGLLGEAEGVADGADGLALVGEELGVVVLQVGGVAAEKVGDQMELVRGQDEIGVFLPADIGRAVYSDEVGGVSLAERLTSAVIF